MRPNVYYEVLREAISGSIYYDCVFFKILRVHVQYICSAFVSFHHLM